MSKKALLIFIILVGIFLRVWGLDFGLPGVFHQDEPIIVNHALSYASGDLNPHFFAIPPFASYLLFFLYGILFCIGKIFGFWQGVNDFALHYFNDPTIFFIVGRFFLGVIPSILSVYLTFSITRDLLEEKAAVYAAAIMSFSFINVVNAHYVYVDMLLVLAILIFYRGVLSFVNTTKSKYFYLSAIILGLSTGIKYNAILLVLPLFLAHCYVHYKGKEKWLTNMFSKDLVKAGVLALGVYFIVNPFSLLDFSEFISSFSKQSEAFWQMGWTHHLSYSLAEGVSSILAILGVLGLLALPLRTKKGWIFLSFPLALYVVMVFKSQPFARYVLPLIPFISMGVSFILFYILSENNKTKFLKKFAIICAIMILIPTTIKSVKADMLFSSGDTRDVSAYWIKENLSGGTKIACDSTAFRPNIVQPRSQLLEKIMILKKTGNAEPAKIKKLEYMIEVSSNDEGYPIYFMFENPDLDSEFVGMTPSVPYDIDVLKEKGIEYITINTQYMDEYKKKFLLRNSNRIKLIKVFTPYIVENIEENIDYIASTFMPMHERDLLLRDKTGPIIRVYRIE